MSRLRAIRFMSVLGSIAVAAAGIYAGMNGRWGWLIAAVIADLLLLYVGAGAHLLIMKSGIGQAADLVLSAHFLYLDTGDAAAARRINDQAVDVTKAHGQHNPNEFADVRLLALTQRAALLCAVGELRDARMVLNEALRDAERRGIRPDDLGGLMLHARELDMTLNSQFPSQETVRELYVRAMDSAAARR